jgi:hypothetical protein
VHDILVVIRSYVHVAVFVVTAEISVFGIMRIDITETNTRSLELEELEFS